MPERPPRLDGVRWLGDKRTMRVHDLDRVTTPCSIDELVASERYATFGPDVVEEARNRGYRPCRHCRSFRVA